MSGSSSTSAPLVGTVVNNYEVRAPIGGGGMGTVYLAEHTFIGRKVAIKVLRRVYSEDPEMVARFMNEARAANAIGHPNIIDIIDVGRLEDGLPYLMMEHLEGETLAQRLGREGKLPLGDALAIIKQATAALGAAHAAGIVHRDLKPENLFLSVDGLGQQRVKVLDFGIAKLHHVMGANLVETSGGLMGTPLYMSPEQCRGPGVEVDARADVYAVGTLLYQMLCGEVPFTSAAAGDVLLMQLTATPRPLRSLNPDIPAAIEAVIDRALAKSPEDRPADMEALQRALDEAMIWPPVMALALTPPPALAVTPPPLVDAPPAGVAVPVTPVAASPLEPTPAPLAPAVEAPAASVAQEMAQEVAQGAPQDVSKQLTPIPSSPVIPPWVVTPTAATATPLPVSPERAPFSHLLGRPRRAPVVLLGVAATAAALLLFAFGPWSKAASLPAASPAIAVERPAAAAAPPAAAAVAPPAVLPSKVAPAAPARAKPAPPLAAKPLRAKHRRKSAGRARLRRAAAAQVEAEAEAAPAPMGKW